MVDVRPTSDLSGWVHDHHQKRSYVYKLASKKIVSVAEQTKQHYDRKAHATPLLIGERVWTRDRNRQGDLTAEELVC